MSKKNKARQRVVVYFMSIHYGICVGPIDKLLRILVGEKEAWVPSGLGRVRQSNITIPNNEMFGGLKKEGGVGGVVEYMPGADDQVVSEELAGRLGLTSETCPGFRGLASLFFRNVDNSSAGFYWSANSPYLRGVWAEVQCIENHPNSYDWYPSKAAIPRLTDPLTEEEENDPDGIARKTDTRAVSSFIVVEGVTGNIGAKWDTNGNYCARAEFSSIEDNFYVWRLPSGDEVTGGDGDVSGLHITDYGELVIRARSDGRFKFYNASDGALIAAIGGGGLGTQGGVYWDTLMDDIVSGSAVYIMAFTLTPFGTGALVVLKRDGATWSLVEDKIATNVIQTLALGPSYGYGIRATSWLYSAQTATTEVVRIALSGLAETVVDLASLAPGITNIAAVGYDEVSDTVIVACANGDLYTFNPALTELRHSLTGNPFSLIYATMSHRDTLLSKRMVCGDGMIAFRSVASPGDIYRYDFVGGLALTQTIDVSEVGYPAYDQLNPLFSFQGNNKIWNGMFFPTHFLKSPFWFVGPAPRYDMNPAHIILESLTNKRWGMGQPITNLDLDSFTAAADTLYSENLGLSLMWARQATIEKFISEIIDHIEATLYIAPSTGLLTLKLLRDDYDPNTLPIYDEDNCTVIEFQRKSMADIINEVVVSWTNPANEDNKTVTRQDLGGIAAQGGIVSDSRDYYGVRSATLAGRLADRDLRAGSYPLATAIIEADRTAWDLVPGGVIKLSDPEHGIGVLVMRILSVDYGRPSESRVHLELVEDVFSLDLATFVQPPGGSWVPSGELPREMAFSQTLTLPYFNVAQAGLAADAVYPEVVGAVMGAPQGNDTPSFELYGTVIDAAGNETLQNLGTKTVLARGTLADAMAAEVTTTLTLLDVDATQGEGGIVGGFALLGNGDEEQDEWVLITAIASGVATLQRGVLDTVPRAWPVGTPIWFFSVNSRFHDGEVRSVAEQVSYKLLSRTSRGLLEQYEAPYVYLTLGERPWLPTRPANVKVNGTAFGGIDVSGDSPQVLTVTWSLRNRVTEDSQPLAWDAAGVTPEDGQLTIIRILDADTREVLYTASNLAGSSHTMAVADIIAGISPVPPVIIVQVKASNDVSSPDFESLQGHEISVVIRDVDALAIIGTPVLTGSVGATYTGFTVTALNGAPPYTFTLIGTWPPGISSISQSGASAEIGVNNVPTTAGTYTGLSVRVTDSLGSTAQLSNFTITISVEDTTPPTLTNPTGGDVP